MYSCGTNAFCPPEILANFDGENRLVDRTKHDVFSLGVIMFEARPPARRAPFPTCSKASMHPCPSPSSTSLASAAGCNQA